MGSDHGARRAGPAVRWWHASSRGEHCPVGQHRQLACDSRARPMSSQPGSRRRSLPGDSGSPGDPGARGAPRADGEELGLPGAAREAQGNESQREAPVASLSHDAEHVAVPGGEAPHGPASPRGDCGSGASCPGCSRTGCGPSSGSSARPGPRAVPTSRLGPAARASPVSASPPWARRGRETGPVQIAAARSGREAPRRPGLTGASEALQDGRSVCGHHRWRVVRNPPFPVEQVARVRGVAGRPRRWSERRSSLLSGRRGPIQRGTWQPSAPRPTDSRQVLGGSRAALLLGRELLVGGGGRIELRSRPRVADVGQQAEQLHPVDGACPRRSRP